MKKRLTAWLLVFCMALSLLPGTAFAAENSGGGDDGKATIFYHLNDGKSSYTLQLKTTPGQEPENSPGAIWSGRPFLGWTQQDKVSAPTYSNNEHLYAQWDEGYEFTLKFQQTIGGTGGTGGTTIGPPDTSLPTSLTGTLKTGSDGKIKAENVTDIEKAINDYLNDHPEYAFSGWFIGDKPFDLATDRVPTYGAEIHAEWEQILTVKFHFNTPTPTPPATDTVVSLVTGTGGTLSNENPATQLQAVRNPEESAYAKKNFSFGGWYITGKGYTPIPTGTLNPTGIATTTGIRVDLTKSFAEYAETGKTTIDVHANWGPPYTITFKANGGNFGNVRDTEKQVETTDQSQLQLPENPVWVHHEFLGWATDKDAADATIKFDKNGQPIGTLPIISLDAVSTTTYYAVWEEQKTITIDYKTGRKEVLNIFDENGDRNNFVNFADRLTFEEAIKGGAGVERPKGQSLMDKWQVKKGTVPLYPPNGASSGASSDWTARQVQAYVQNTCTDSITITATWEDGYYIKFYPNGGKVDTGTTGADVEYLEIFTDSDYKITPAELADKFLPPDGYGPNVVSWHTGTPCTDANKYPLSADPDDLTNPYYHFDKEENLYAKWGGPYRITYNLNGGGFDDTKLPTGVKKDGNRLYSETDPDNGNVLNYLPKESDFSSKPTNDMNDTKTFVGWYDESGKPVDLNTTYDKPTTLTAHWQDKDTTVTIVYDYQAGTDGSLKPNEDTTNTVLEYLGNDSYRYPKLAKPERTNMTFVGWYTVESPSSSDKAVENFSVVSKTDIKPDRHVYLYAQWAPTKSLTPTAPASLQAAPAPIKKPASVPALQAANPGISALAVTPGEYTIHFYLNTDTTKPTDVPYTDSAGKAITRTTKDGRVTVAFPEKPSYPDTAIAHGFTSDDYQFAGWYKLATGGSVEVTGTETFAPDDADADGEINLYAYWNHRITFNANGGKFTGDNEVRRLYTKNGKLDTHPETPTRAGYTFDGWFENADGSGNQYVYGDPFTAPDVLYAKWTKDHYTVTFDLGYDGATPITPRETITDTTNSNEILETLPSPTRAGYEFAGWWTSASEGEQKPQAKAAFDRDTVLYARWKQVFTITFEHNNGTGKTTVKTVASGGKLTGDDDMTADANKPTYKGHKFIQWLKKDDNTPYSSSMTFSADTTFYAEWEEQNIIVKFNANDPTIADGVTNDNIPDQVAKAGRLDNFPTLKNHRGYTFLGWFTSVNGSDKVGLDGPWPNNATTVELFAHWQENKPDATTAGLVIYIVDIDPMPTDEKAQDELAHFTMKPNGSGYLQHYPVLSLDTASGWHKKGDEKNVDTNTSYPADTSTYLYVGTAKRYPITLDWQYEDDTGSPVITVISTDDDGILRNWPETDNVRPDSTFKGWYTEKTGGTQVPEDTPFTGPTTIYAQWKSPYKITFDANGGQWEEDGKTETIKTVSTSKDGILATADIPANPTREGYKTFVGWGLTKDATEKVNPATYGVPYEGPVTFYAIWGPPYEIKYNVMGGNEFTPTEAQSWSTEDGKYPELPVPTHSRDTFGGWYTTETFDEGTLAETGADCPGAVTLYAKWNHEPPYNIIFNANLDGAVMEDPTSGSSVTTLTLKTDDKGVLLQAPPEPTIRGGKFQGWYTKAEEGTGELISDIATHVFEDDTTLYAHWDTMEFTITFDFNLSSIGKDFNITTYTTTKGKSLSFLPGELPQAASETKKIEGWYTVPNPVAGKDQPVTTSNTFERDTTLYAKWVDAPDLPIVFKYPNVTFLDAENGNAMVTLEVDKDYKMASVPPGPYKEGLTFSGWFYREPDRPDGEEKQFTKDTEVTGSLRVYPKYVGSGYTVTFEPGEESELDPIKVKTTSEGRIPDGSMPSPTWEGHTFAGWYTSAEGGTKITRRTVFTQDTTVYAHWDSSGGPEDPDDPDKPDKPGPTSPPFTITFNPNGGNLNANTTALTDLNGRLMSLPTPARTGYHFDGWYNGNERVTTATVFSANTTITAQWSTGSGGGSGDSGSGELNGYAITVSNTSGGRVSVSTTYAREGDRVTVTVRPYSGYQLDRVDVVNARGYDVELRDQGSNRYVFYMPASRVTVDAVFMELIANTGNGGNTGNSSGSTGGNTSWNPGGSTGGNTSWNPGGTTSGTSSGLGIFSQPVLNTVPMPYLDVHASDWYYSSVDYMWQRQLMGGVSSNRFGPQATTSNAMVWTILARLAGVDVTSGASVWYENARSWAVSNRISDGVGPNSAVTREQLATMLWNFKGSPAASYDLGQFGDRGQISTYQAECALGWAVANGIVSGTGNRLNPRGTATRAEVAAMITRFCQNT